MERMRVMFPRLVAGTYNPLPPTVRCWTHVKHGPAHDPGFDSTEMITQTFRCAGRLHGHQHCSICTMQVPDGSNPVHTDMNLPVPCVRCRTRRRI